MPPWLDTLARELGPEVLARLVALGAAHPSTTPAVRDTVRRLAAERLATEDDVQRLTKKEAP